MMIFKEERFLSPSPYQRISPGVNFERLIIYGGAVKVELPALRPGALF